MDAHRVRLYRDNAFRILGVGVGATAREARRKAEERRIQADLRGADQAELDRIRVALAEIEDPPRRLVAELFWLQLAPELLPADLDIDDRRAVTAAIARLAPLAAQRSEVALHDLALLEHVAAALDGPAAVDT